MTLLERETCLVKELQLPDGSVALVDEADYDALRVHKWSRASSGYAVRYVGNSRLPGRRVIRMHRQLMAIPGEVDHANGDKLDNRRANLRPATRQQQNANTAKRCDGLTSRFKGVSLDHRPLSRRWVAQIQVDGRHVFLGRYATEEQAASVYAAAAVAAFGEFARPASR